MTTDEYNQQVQIETGVQNLNARLSSMQERIAATEHQQERLAADLQTLRAEIRTGDTESQRRVEAINARLTAVDEARARDRTEIVSGLSSKMAEMISKMTPPPPRPSAARPAPAAGSGSPQAGYEHVVQQGQTLSDISKAYGVKVDAIMRANNMKKGDILKVGQKLFIPD